MIQIQTDEPDYMIRRELSFAVVGRMQALHALVIKAEAKGEKAEYYEECLERLTKIRQALLLGGQTCSMEEV